MKVRSKLILLISISAAGALIFLSIIARAQSGWLGSIFAVELRGLEDRCDRITKLVSLPIENFVNDNSFWDDMVTFVRTADMSWAKENIEAPLAPYKADGAWVYALDEGLVYSTRSPEVTALNKLPLPAGAMKRLFERARFCHFYVLTTAGLLEIHGATIHPSADIKRETPPQGYFFVGKLWTKEYAGMLGELIPASVSVDPVLQARKPTSDRGRGVIVFGRALRDWVGTTTAVMVVRAESEPVKIFNAMREITLAAIILFALSLIIVLAGFLARWVISPLIAIQRSLNEQDPAILKGMALRGDEFGRIAALIRKSFEEHDLLADEVITRKKTERELSLSNERFMKVFRSNPSMMTVSKFATGEFIDINEPFIETVGYSRQEIIGHTSLELGILTPETRARIIGKVREAGTIRNEEIEVITKRGEKRICLFSGESMDVGGEGIMVGVFLDITLRKQAEDALRQKVKELEQFNKMAVGREARMVELKERIRALEERLR